MDTVLIRDLVQTQEVEIKTGPFGTQLKASEYVDRGTPVLNVRNLGFSTVNTEKIEMVGNETIKRLSAHTLHTGDIVFGRKGAVERHAFISEFEDGWMQGSDCIRLRVKNERINARYLSYYFLTPQHRSFMLSMCSHGTTMASLNQKIIEMISIPLPERKVQDQVVAVLSALDEKIKNNQEINDNLQQQAQAIYSSMFIDNSESAWTHGHLSDLVTVKYGKDHKKLSEGIYPVYGSGGIMRYVERPLYDKESVLIPRKGTLNNVMYVNQPFWSVDTMFYTEMKLPNVAKFVYHFVKAKDLASMNAGSAVPSMTTDILNAMEVVIPSASALEEFEALVAPMYEAMEANDVQSQALSKVRDTLLPKLMSGEIDVSSVLL